MGTQDLRGSQGVVSSGVGAAAGEGVEKAQGMGFADRQRPVCIYEEDVWEGPSNMALLKPAGTERQTDQPGGQMQGPSVLAL